MEDHIEVWNEDVDYKNGGWECTVWHGGEVVGVITLDLKDSLSELEQRVWSYFIQNDDQELADLPVYFSWVPTNHCWVKGCQSNPINRLTDPCDGDYGNFCRICGNSLRTHPFFGEGRAYDLGNRMKRWAWGGLSEEEKAQVYIQHGFRPPRRKHKK